MKISHNSLIFLLTGIALGALLTFLFLRPISIPQSETDTLGIGKLRSGMSVPQKKDVARYENRYYGFAISYPMELTQREFNEGADAITVAFQKPDEEKGFQIFIIPYEGDQISQERIQQDLAGSPMENVKEIILPGGVRAVHFESRAPIIGDSTEVWFIHNGYLFEVTTYRALDSWLAEILSTIRFST